MNIIAWFFLVIGVAAVFLHIGVLGLVRATVGRPFIDPRLAVALLIPGIGFAVMAFIGLWVSS